MNIQWEPLYSIERSGIAEVTISGAICVVEGTKNGHKPPQPLLSCGDVGFPLWTRSLLKPWQLLSHFNELTESYPKLEPRHLAIMMASHNAEPSHLELLEEIMAIGGCNEEQLRCPATYPLWRESRVRLEADGKPARRLYHNCSGKHFGYLMTLKSEGGNTAEYLNSGGTHFAPLKKVLCAALHKEYHELPVTTDGCQLPNYAISIQEMATLYQGLANVSSFAPTGDNHVDLMLATYPELMSIMSRHPVTVGGTDRLDTNLMVGAANLVGSPTIIAKEGAEGLLAIGVGKTDSYPNGLGILIKLCGGTDKIHTDRIATEVLAQLGLGEHGPTVPVQPRGTRTDHLRIKFHFNVRNRQPAQV